MVLFMLRYIVDECIKYLGLCFFMNYVFVYSIMYCNIIKVIVLLMGNNCIKYNVILI